MTIRKLDYYFEFRFSGFWITKIISVFLYGWQKNKPDFPLYYVKYLIVTHNTVSNKQTEQNISWLTSLMQKQQMAKQGEVGNQNLYICGSRIAHTLVYSMSTERFILPAYYSLHKTSALFWHCTQFIYQHFCARHCYYQDN